MKSSEGKVLLDQKSIYFALIYRNCRLIFLVCHEFAASDDSIRGKNKNKQTDKTIKEEEEKEMKILQLEKKID